MSWRPINFQGIVSLDRSIVDQMEEYLQEKETRLAHTILNVMQPLPAEAYAPLLPGGHLKLSDAVEGFSKRVRHFNNKAGPQAVSPENAEKIVREMNIALESFAEVLEGCSIELFQQMRQVNVDHWHVSLFHVVTSIKDMLLHRIEDLIWAVRRLENPLQEYCQKCEAAQPGWKKWTQTWQSRLNPEILKNLKQSEVFLRAQCEAFQHRYNEYKALNAQVEAHLEKMKTYPALALLDIPDQNLYVDTFRLLKLWEFNPKPKGLFAFETIRSLKYLSSVDGVLRAFRIYYYGLRDAFFNSSLELKALRHESHYPEERVSYIRNKVNAFHEELRPFIDTMRHYREFMLKTADQGLRSRWGLKDWLSGPEPAKVQQLSLRIKRAEELNRWYHHFLKILDKKPLAQERIESHLHAEIDKIIHEMEQPLISRSMMSQRAHRLLEYLKECDEVGSSYEQTIYYIGDALDRAMRADWKYHVLHDIPLFHELYHLHQGLQKEGIDPPHAFRLEKFYEIFGQIEEWVNKEDIYAHIHEIELDINDMKIYLQDFLAAIQRAAREREGDPFLDETIDRYKQQLLEYRYLFGRFFFNLMAKNWDSQQLRTYFLFVDQYFESAENLLRDLGKNSRSESAIDQ